MRSWVCWCEYPLNWSMFQAPKSKHLLNRSRIFGFVELLKRVIDRFYRNLKKWTTINKSGFLGWMFVWFWNITFENDENSSWGARGQSLQKLPLLTSRHHEAGETPMLVEGPARVKRVNINNFCDFCNCIMIIYIYNIYIYMCISAFF